MRQVKPLMVAKHILAGLWLLVWLTASLVAHARVGNSGAGAPAFASTDGQGDEHGEDLAGLRFQALRTSRRFDFQSTPSDPVVDAWFLNTCAARQHDGAGLHVGSEASPGLASGWHFLLRMALSPRAPSLVS
jgi:hypothetical protein